MQALQESTEARSVSLFEAANECAIHAKRVRVKAEDLKLAQHISEKGKNY